LKSEVIFVDIGGTVDHHSMSLGERLFLLILVELFTITQCIEVTGDFYCTSQTNFWKLLNGNFLIVTTYSNLFNIRVW
jgi:hypothetical protein